MSQCCKAFDGSERQYGRDRARNRAVCYGWRKCRRYSDVNHGTSLEESTQPSVKLYQGPTAYGKEEYAWLKCCVRERRDTHDHSKPEESLTRVSFHCLLL